jgi:ferredoxin
VPECPVHAIDAEDDVPGDEQDFTPFDAELARVWKPLTKTTKALPDADTWASVEDKRAHLER